MVNRLGVKLPGEGCGGRGGGYDHNGCGDDQRLAMPGVAADVIARLLALYFVAHYTTGSMGSTGSTSATNGGLFDLAIACRGAFEGEADRLSARAPSAVRIRSHFGLLLVLGAAPSQRVT